MVLPEFYDAVGRAYGEGNVNVEQGCIVRKFIFWRSTLL